MGYAYRGQPVIRDTFIGTAGYMGYAYRGQPVIRDTFIGDSRL